MEEGVGLPLGRGSLQNPYKSGFSLLRSSQPLSVVISQFPVELVGELMQGTSLLHSIHLVSNVLLHNKYSFSCKLIMLGHKI